MLLWGIIIICGVISMGCFAIGKTSQIPGGVNTGGIFFFPAILFGLICAVGLLVKGLM